MKNLFSTLFIFALCFVTLKAESSNLVDDISTTMSNAADSIAATATAIDTSSVTKMLYSDIKVGLLVATKGAVKGLSVIFDVYSKYYFWKGISYLIAPLFLFIVAFICFKMRGAPEYKRNYTTDKQDPERGVADFEDQPAMFITFSVASIIIGLLACVILFCTIQDTILMMTTPEYYVIQDLVKMIK
jgi:hypothetical protein